LNRRQLEACDWTPGDLQPHEETVEIFSNCEQVELQLNGRSLGTKPLPKDASPRTWKVQFEPGALEAIGRNAGKIVARDKLQTAGKPARITLTADRDRVTPDFDDVVRVTAVVVDKDGVPVPAVDDLITFNSIGPGTIVAVDNGDNASHEPFQASERHAFRGQCVAFVRATASKGHITVNASAPGLEAGSVKLTATGH